MSVGDAAISLVIGVISALIGLWLLFSIKPKLRLALERREPNSETWEELTVSGWNEAATKQHSSTEKKDYSPRILGVCECQPKPRRIWLAWEKFSGDGATCHLCEKRFQPAMPVKERDQIVHYSVNVENLGLSNVVEIEARLWYIRSGPPDTRHRISLGVDRLMDLSGSWREAQRTSTEIKHLLGDRFFRFQLPDDGLDQVTPEMLGVRDRYLFQVWSKHGFTNFGKVHKLRIKTGDGDFKYLYANAERQPGFLTAITRLIKHKWLNNRQRS